MQIMVCLHVVEKTRVISITEGNNIIHRICKTRKNMLYLNHFTHLVFSNLEKKESKQTAVKMQLLFLLLGRLKIFR